MKSLLITGEKVVAPLRRFSTCILSPLYDLAARLYLAYAFGVSGLGRLESYRNGSWDDQVFLFTEEHPVPFVSGEIAAPLTTGAELLLPFLLIIGLFNRFAAAGLFVMALTIELTYLSNFQHWLWMALAASIFVKGGGALSLDTLLLSWIKPNTNHIKP